MPRKLKARQPTPPPVFEDDNSLIDDLLAQIEDTQQPEQPQSLPPHSNPAPQKRNAKSRFLARQARKAAAIAQASPNVDPAAEERLQLEIREEEESIKRTCDQLGLHLFHINPDGHCLFSAVADQLSLLGIVSKSQPAYMSIRRAAADYIQAHPDDFIPFLPSPTREDGIMSHSEFEQYCTSIRDTAEWGGEPEILALSRAYGVAIHVVQGGSPSIVKHEPEEADAKASDRSIAFISYHRRMYGLGEHYNSLHRKSTS